MHLWVLIILVYGHTINPAMTNVGPFKSEADCQTAARQVRHDLMFDDTDAIAVSCVAVVDK